jgi:serine/threonine-protein kinase
VPTAHARAQLKKLGSFEVVEEIGQGGMGVVYLARQPALERNVVLKKMRRDLTIDPSAVERFEREARAAAAVHHQNVVAVYDCFSIRGDHYIAEEYVDGPDLRSVLEEAKPLESRIAALIGLEVMRGLEEIHARGIVHRDLKPGNILIGSGGETKIADFGIALDGKAFGLTRPGTLMGSIPYLSPEQMLGERVDYRSDLFVFGILLYEMITGAPPFEESGEDAKDTLLERMQSGRYASPRERAENVPRYLARLIKSCLHPKPSKRIGTATEVRRQLERRLGRVSPADCRLQIATWFWERGLIRPAEGQTEMRPASVPSSLFRGGLLKRPAARWLVPAAIASLLICLGVAGSAFGIFSPRRSDPVALDPNGPVVMQEQQSNIAALLEGPVLGTEPDAAGALDASPPPPLPAPAPASVRFAAWPWAEVRIEEGPSFLTPRAAPLALSPGSHVVVFEHPTYGRAEYALELAPGEERLVRHVFEEAPRP